ncbi:lipase-like PAD4 [Cryptomeria japonica]|uniref:lipase-like PAD4 n=1 Tax=Cryptomeria japonica TaxID=3369 RepID=UPI0027D9F126|nr:lipase-like PAD4 [Cryptomeria japonica]XP_059077750.1 lipase-like PAD4 [Cryptomeria japonica]
MFTVGEEQAIFLSSCEILERAWGETRSISNNNDITYFGLSEYESVVFITFPSFYIGDFTASDSPYGQCDIQNENEVFSDRLKGDDDQPALVHNGALNMFLNILRNSDLETQMDKFSKQRKEQTIIFVGHSIGGAIATLATIWVLEKRLRQISPICITFGSPLVGDTVLIQSIDCQGWSGNFCHVVSKNDIVPRMLLAPFESIGQQLNSIFPPRGSIMVNDSASLMHPSSPEACRKLLDNIKCLGESSPYKPIGTYMFFSVYGAACVEDPQAVLKMLVLTLQNTEENGIEEENSIAAALISEHVSYGDKLRHVIESACSTRTSNLSSESSFEMGIALQLEAMGFQTQNNYAFDALKGPEDLKNKLGMDIENLNKNLSERQSEMAELEWYIKTVCEGNSRSLYDVFRDLDEKKDSRVNLIRISLRNFWDEIVEMVKNQQLPNDFRYQNKWINAGTAYRRLVEPLDIAAFYHLQNERGNYLSIGNRPVRHMVLEKWLDDKNQTRTGRDRRPRTKFASLTEDSCFWAHVEEAAKDLTNLQQEQERHQVINAHLKESLENFEVYVSKMIEEKSISEEVFLKQSSFKVWWNKYKEFQLQYPEWISSSPLLRSMENLNMEV